MPGNTETSEQVKDEAASKAPEVKRPRTAKEKEEEKARLLAEIEEERKKKKEEAERQQKLEEQKRKRKLITPGVMLAVGLIASVTMYLMHFENERMLIWLLIILLVSGIIGRLIQYMFDKFAIQNEETVPDDGEVINKGSDTSEEVK